MSLTVRLVVLLGLLAAGVAAREVGLVEGRRRKRLNAAAFYVVIPALVFTSTYDRALEDVVSVELVGGLWLVLAAVVAASWLLHRTTEPRETRSVATIQSYHSNMGYLGLPLAVLLLGEAAAGPASVVFGVTSLTQTALTVLLLVGMNDAGGPLSAELRAVAYNPIVLSLAAGVLVGTLSVPVPGAVTAVLERVASLALPLALVLVGSSLALERPDADLRALSGVVGLKVLIMPVVAWVVFTGLGVAPLVRATAVVMFGAPTAVSTYVYASELGGDPDFASTAILATTVVSVVTLGAVAQVLV